MTINGTAVPASAYFYWMSYYAGYLRVLLPEQWRQ